MKKFTNKNVEKAQKSILRLIIIGVVLILISFACKYWERLTIEKVNQNMTDLNTIILSSGEKENQKAYLDAMSKPYKFAVYDDTTDSYYIVSDGKYMYIVYMSITDFTKLDKESIYDNAIRIEGITKSTTLDVKKLAIEAYNDSLDNQEEALTLADFENYFGSVYLDLTVNDSAVATIPMALFLLFLLFGIILFASGLWQLIQFNRNIKKMDDTMIHEIDNEMNDNSAFYYEKAKVYLTEHYIINFGGTFRVIRYEDILWMYPFIQRTNGIKTSQSIKVFLNTGKTYTIATIDMVTKKKKEAYEEIWETIRAKNDKMLTGYTKENIKTMNAKLKEIRKKK